MGPEELVDINHLNPAGTRIERRNDGFYLGAFATTASISAPSQRCRGCRASRKLSRIIPSLPDRSISQQARYCATWRRSAATSCSARGATIFVILPGARVTSPSLGPVAPRSMGSPQARSARPQRSLHRGLSGRSRTGARGNDGELTHFSRRAWPLRAGHRIHDIARLPAAGDDRQVTFESCGLFCCDWLTSLRLAHQCPQVPGR
jgi:hypothetical protein